MRCLTLVEILIVLVILATLAGLTLPLVGDATAQAADAATRTSLPRIRKVIVGGDGQPGYLADVGELPRPAPSEGRAAHPQLRYLFLAPADAPAWDPARHTGWRGPYLQDGTARYRVEGSFSALYGEDDDPCIIDGWGQPIVLQEPDTSFTASERRRYARLISAGPDGVLDTPRDALIPDVDSRGDDLVLFLSVADLP